MLSMKMKMVLLMTLRVIDMEGFMVEFGWMLAALFIGVALGSLTVNPGFHVNNVALILLAVSPAILSIGIPLSAVAGIIVSTGVVHTFRIISRLH